MKGLKNFRGNRKNKATVIILFVLTFCLFNAPFVSFAGGANSPDLKTQLRTYEYLLYYHEDYKSIYLDYKARHPKESWERAIISANMSLEAPFYTDIQPVTDPEAISCLVNKTYQLEPTYIPQNLELISKKYSSGNLYLRKEAKVAFESMCGEAKTLGLRIRAISAYRSYDLQKSIYYKKIRPKDPASIVARDKSVARAGHSEHQLGLAVDVRGTGSWVGNTAEYAWYSKNAHRFGYIIRYPKEQEAQTGYRFEPWHLRYVGVEMAQKVYQSGMILDVYTHMVTAQEPKAERVVVQRELGGISANFEGYQYNEKNYIKLRELEKVLSQTPLAFNIQWEKETKILLLTNKLNKIDTADTADTADTTTSRSDVQPPLVNKQNEICAIQVKAITIVQESDQNTYDVLEKDGQMYIAQEDLTWLMER